jgi:DNA-binding transcriptional LysR family regulator
MDWDNIQTFLAIFRNGRLSLAARELGVSEATARRRLDDLEALGVGALFERAPGGLMPTPTALKLAQLAARMEGELLAVTDGGSGARREIAGEVRVTADELIALEILPPLFAELTQRYPNLVLARRHGRRRGSAAGRGGHRRTAVQANPEVSGGAPDSGRASGPFRPPQLCGAGRIAPMLRRSRKA